jgi:hypothetical protein
VQGFQMTIPTTAAGTSERWSESAAVVVSFAGQLRQPRLDPFDRLKLLAAMGTAAAAALADVAGGWYPTFEDEEEDEVVYDDDEVPF